MRLDDSRITNSRGINMFAMAMAARRSSRHTTCLNLLGVALLAGLIAPAAARLTAIEQTFGSSTDQLRYLSGQVGNYGVAVL